MPPIVVISKGKASDRRAGKSGVALVKIDNRCNYDGCIAALTTVYFVGGIRTDEVFKQIFCPLCKIEIF